jgi:hypothetical protein
MSLNLTLKLELETLNLFIPFKPKEMCNNSPQSLLEKVFTMSRYGIVRLKTALFQLAP